MAACSSPLATTDRWPRWEPLSKRLDDVDIPRLVALVISRCGTSYTSKVIGISRSATTGIVARCAHKGTIAMAERQVEELCKLAGLSLEEERSRG